MEDIYQVDEVSVLLTMVARRAATYLDCEVVEQLESILWRLTTEWYPLDRVIKEAI